MQKRRGRQPADPKFPYGKSVIASVVLIVGFMLLLAVLGDAKSGRIGAARLTLLALAALPVLIAAVFYAEFRSRNKRRVRQGKERGAKGYLSAKC